MWDRTCTSVCKVGREGLVTVMLRIPPLLPDDSSSGSHGGPGSHPWWQLRECEKTLESTGIYVLIFRKKNDWTQTSQIKCPGLMNWTLPFSKGRVTTGVDSSSSFRRRSLKLLWASGTGLLFFNLLNLLWLPHQFFPPPLNLPRPLPKVLVSPPVTF